MAEYQRETPPGTNVFIIVTKKNRASGLPFSAWTPMKSPNL